MEQEDDYRRLYAGRHHARFIDEHTPMHIISKTFQSRYLLTPCEDLNNLILGIIGRAQTVYPKVALHAITFMSNHMHAIMTGPADETAGFIGLVKREISRRWGGSPQVGWSDSMWTGYLATALPTPESQVTALRYVLSQGVKEDLVERPQDWPGVHCVYALMLGRTLSGRWMNASNYGHAKVLEKRKRTPGFVRRADFLEDYCVTLKPLPVWRELSKVEQRTAVAKLVAEITAEARERRRKTGAKVKGAVAVRAMSRDTRKIVPRPPWWQQRRRMIVWADPRNSETREYVRRYWEFQKAFFLASRSFLAGELDVDFPPRAFRPVSWRSPDPPTAN